MFQKTISKNIKIAGKGLFSGEKVTMILKPAPVSTGIIFIVNGQKIPANFNNIFDTSRRTIIGNEKIKIKQRKRYYGDSSINFLRGFDFIIVTFFFILNYIMNRKND